MNTNIIDQVIQRAIIQPDRAIYHFLNSDLDIDHTITLGDVKNGIDRSIGILQAFTGNTCLIILPKSADFIHAFLGCLAAGVYAVPLSSPNHSKLSDRIQSVTNDSGAKVVISNRLVYKKIAEREENLEFLNSLQWLFIEDLLSAPAKPELVATIERSGLAFLQYTSGSTGNPKGVMVSHQNILHSSEYIQYAFGNNEQTRGFCWLPIFHDMGLIEGVIQPLFSNYPVFHLEPRDFVTRPIRWLQGMSRYQATVSGGPNFAYELCSKRCSPEQVADLKLDQLQILFCAAEMVRASTLKRFQSAFSDIGITMKQMIPGYGMAEATLAITFSSRFDDHIITESISVDGKETHDIVGVGRASLGIIVKIVSPDSLQEVEDGVIGEMWVKGESNCLGYWQKDDGTYHNTLNGEAGFLRTGDLGFFKNGELFFTGRLKDLIIINGVNYHPEDLEYQLSAIHPATNGWGIAAFSIDKDDKERVILAVEVGRSTCRDQAEQAIIISTLKKAFFVSFGFTLTDLVLISPYGLPRTTSGKISRSASRAAYLQETLKVISSD